MACNRQKYQFNGDLNRLVICWDPPSVILLSPRHQQLKF
jgi:hypothetical protein